MDLLEIRRRLRTAGRNTNDPSYYKTVFLDECIDRLCARFLRVTRCVKLAFTVDFDASDNEVDFSDLAGFLPGRIERMRIDTDTHYTIVREDLNQVDVGEVLDRLSCRSSTTSTYCGETFIGFTETDTAKLYPAPGFNGTISGTYCPLQTPWTLGAMGAHSTSNTYSAGDVVSSSGTIYRAKADVDTTGVAVSNTASWANEGAGTLVAPENIVSIIPDGIMSELIGTGGPPILQAVDREQTAFAGPQWQNYLTFETSCIGIGTISGKSMERGSLRSCR